MAILVYHMMTKLQRNKGHINLLTEKAEPWLVVVEESDDIQLSV